MTDAEQFGKRLSRVRVQRKLTQEALAEQAQAGTAQSISVMESGDRYPRIHTLIALADALEVSIDYLLGRTTDALSHLSRNAHAKRDRRLRKHLQTMRSVINHIEHELPADE